MIPYDVAVRVHGNINARTNFATDLELYQRSDFWVVADAFGDCEDFALAKRKAFLDLGYPAKLLNLCVCRTEEQEMHAVLIVKTDRGEFVLDNRHTMPLTKHQLEQLGYKWLKIGVGSKWFAVS